MVHPRIGGEWLRRMREDPAEVLAAAYTQYEHRLRRVIDLRLDRRLARRIDVADVLQDSYVDALLRLDHYLDAPSMPLFEWLRFLVVQRVLAIHRQHFRAKKRDARRDRELSHSSSDEPGRLAVSKRLSADDLTPVAAAIQAESTQLVKRLLGELEASDQQILMLRHMEDMTNQETAKELGITPPAASKRYSRALRRFARLARR